MQNISIEKKIHDHVFCFIGYIVRYVRTLWSMLFHPQRILAIRSSTGTPYLSRPEAFLVTNIVLSYSVAQILGYDVPSFPLEIPQFKNLFGGYFFLIIRFILGLLIFLVILKRLVRFKNRENFFSAIFPVFCYCSVVYLPFVLIKGYSYNHLNNDLLNVWSIIASGAPLQLPNLLFLIAKYVLISLIISVALLSWWLWIVHRGIRHSRIISTAKPWKALILTCITFFAFQMLLVSVSSIIANRDLLSSFKIILYNEIQNELSKTPPNYAGAAFLSREISDNKNLPKGMRYIYKIKQVTYELATPLFGGKEGISIDALMGIEEKKYRHVHKLLEEHIKILSLDNVNPRRPFYLQFKKNLEEAQQLHDSPSFVYFESGTIELALLFSSAQMRYAIDLNNKMITLYFVVQPSWISLFP